MVQPLYLLLCYSQYKVGKLLILVVSFIHPATRFHYISTFIVTIFFIVHRVVQLQVFRLLVHIARLSTVIQYAAGRHIADDAELCTAVHLAANRVVFTI